MYWTSSANKSCYSRNLIITEVPLKPQRNFLAKDLWHFGKGFRKVHHVCSWDSACRTAVLTEFLCWRDDILPALQNTQASGSHLIFGPRWLIYIAFYCRVFHSLFIVHRCLKTRKCVCATKPSVAVCRTAHQHTFILKLKKCLCWQKKI